MTDNSTDNNTIVIGGAAQTPGANAHAGSPHNALPVGSRMGEFEIIGLIGEGGFGIVYLAQDHSLERKVALKEYMPTALAARGANDSVVVRSERHQETFEIGRRSFVNEARLLAQFDHPALVKVYRFWEAHGTAYMAMPYYDGHTLRDALRERVNAPDEAWLKKLLDPVTEALSLVHEANCYHRDIAPDNIMLLRDGRPVLLDFGAARRVISDMTQALTVILKPGYAPIEQYAEMPGMRQGPWTDIYALAAVIYFTMAHKLPPPSVSRIVQDSYEPLTELLAGRYSNTFLRGIDHCLALKPENRPQTVAAMRELIGLGARPASAQTPPPRSASSKDLQAPTPDNSQKKAPAKAPPEKARPEPISRPSKNEPDNSPTHLALTVDQDELRSQPGSAPRNTSRILGPSLIVLGAAALGAGWFYLSPLLSTAPAAPSQSEPATQSAPLAEASAPEAVAPPPVEASQPASAAASENAAIEQATAAASEPVTTATSPPADTSPPAEPKPAKANKPVKAKTESGDKAARDYMKKLNKDLDQLLR